MREYAVKERPRRKVKNLQTEEGNEARAKVKNSKVLDLLATPQQDEPQKESNLLRLLHFIDTKEGQGKKAEEKASKKAANPEPEKGQVAAELVTEQSQETEELVVNAELATLEAMDATNAEIEEEIEELGVAEEYQATTFEDAAAEVEVTVVTPPEVESPKIESITPEQDPVFQTVITQTEDTRDLMKQHDSAGKGVTEAKEAAELPESQQKTQNNRGAHISTMNKLADGEGREPITADGFKSLLSTHITDLEKDLPETEDAAEEFKEKSPSPFDTVKTGINSDVKAKKESYTGPLDKTSKTEKAPEAGKATKKAKELKEKPKKKKAAPIKGAAATPKPVAEKSLSMEAESQSMDQLMEENQVTTQQLEKANEPGFTETLGQKKQAQETLATVPGEYKQKEEEKLANAQQQTQMTGNVSFEQMRGMNSGVMSQVLGKQKSTETATEQRKKELFDKFEGIYNDTKTSVNTALETLSTDIESLFSQEVEKVKNKFETNVEKGLDKIYGWFKWDDEFMEWLNGEDKEKTAKVELLFKSTKITFIADMDVVLTDISRKIANVLNEALAIIQDGKKKAEAEYDKLGAADKKLGKEAYGSFNSKYASLETSVYDKQTELSESLADTYTATLDDLRSTFDEIKKKALSGPVAFAKASIMGTIKTILQLKSLLLEALSAAQDVVLTIIADPILFLKNLFSGIAEGFTLFAQNIQSNLTGGLISWLTGSMGSAGITLPEDIMSLPGIFDLVMQVLGLTYDFLRKKAVKLMGEKTVNRLEKIGGKGVEIFKVVKKDGIKGLWAYIKNEFTDLKELVIGAIKEMLITKVIEAGIKWILGLLSPVGAFVKAVMLIVDVVKFFVERGAQIVELVKSFIGAVKAVAEGKVSAVAKAVEQALIKSIPVLLGFLAALLGVGGLTKKVMKIIRKLRKKLDLAVNKMILKVSKLFGKKKGAKGKKGSAKKTKEENKKLKEKVGKVTPKEKRKHVSIAEKIRMALRKPATKEDKTYETFHKRKKKEAAVLEDKYQSKLKKGINLDIKIGNVKSDQKDNDVDFKIKIAPNDTVLKGYADFAKGNAELPDKKFNVGKQQHKLFFKVKEKDAELMIASVPRTFESFIKMVKADDSKEGVKKAREEAIRISKLIDKKADASLGGDTSAEKEEARNRKQAEIEKMLGDLAPHTAILFGVTEEELPKSEITYGATENGMGTGMVAEILTKKGAKGSSPTKAKHAIFDDLLKRRKGGGSFYVRGHLLNDNVHGPGKWNNMTPLSQDGNKYHLREAEEPVKIAVKAGDILYYEVTPIYDQKFGKTDPSEEELRSAGIDESKLKDTTALLKAEQYVPSGLHLFADRLKMGENGKYEKTQNLVVNKTVINPVETNLAKYEIGTGNKKEVFSLKNDSIDDIFKNTDYRKSELRIIQKNANDVGKLRYYQQIIDKIKESNLNELVENRLIKAVNDMQSDKLIKLN